MATKIGINGFGRIGRCITRVLFEQNIKDVEIVGINDLTDANTRPHKRRNIGALVGVRLGARSLQQARFGQRRCDRRR